MSLPLGGRLFHGLDRAARSASGHATAFGFVSGWRMVRWLPESTARALFAGVAERMYAADGKSVRRLRANLARVAPEADLDRLTRAGVHSYLRYWCESFRLPSWPIDDLVRRTRILNEKRLRDAYAAGGGVIVALPHMGNWDWAGAWACGTGMPLMTVAERLEPERLYDEFLAYRERLGMRILPLSGDPSTFPRLVSWLEDGGFVCLLADRDLSRTSVEVTLCGERARMPRGPAVLARRTGAPLIPATLHYEGDELVIDFHEAVEARRGRDGVVLMMQAVADAFTDGIREHPQDWHMMQRVFVDDLGPRD